MLPTDTRETWDSQFLVDPRVTQLWDADRIVGRWLADKQNIDLGETGDIVWDAFLLFGPETPWDSALAPPLAWGAPIVGRFPELVETLTPLLERSGAQASTIPRATRGAVLDASSLQFLTTHEEARRADRPHVVAA